MDKVSPSLNEIERLYASRGAELGELLGRLELRAEARPVLFNGRFMLSHIPPEGTPIEPIEDPRKYLRPQTWAVGPMSIYFQSVGDNSSLNYRVSMAKEFSTCFTSAPDAQWQFNALDPNQSSFAERGNFFISLRLARPSGIYEARFYSLLGKSAPVKKA